MHHGPKVILHMTFILIGPFLEEVLEAQHNIRQYLTKYVGLCWMGVFLWSEFHFWVIMLRVLRFNIGKWSAFMKVPSVGSL